VPVADAIPLLRWEESRSLGAAVAVTTRHGGVSGPPFDTLNLGLHVGDRAGDVTENRARAATAFGVELDTMVFAHQVHGSAVSEVGPADCGRGTRLEEDAVPATDILLTTAPGVTLVILVADCLPVALVDPAARVLAVVHAGWRGTAAGALPAAVRAMERHGARPDRLRAYLGPAVAPECYQVGAEVCRALAGAVHPDGLDPAVTRPDGQGLSLVDLVAANRQQLLRSGLTPAHVADCGVTTAEASLFSDRAQRPCGRFGLLARLLV
jgi:YfiH family protein